MGRYIPKQSDIKDTGIEDIKYHLARNLTDRYRIEDSTVSVQYIDHPIEIMGPCSNKILSKITNFGEKFGPLIANIAAMTRHISALLAGVSIACPPLAIGAAIVGAISAITSLVTVVTKISAKILKHREEKKNNQPKKQVDTAPKPLSGKILSALASIGKDSGSVVSKVSDTIRTLYAVFSAFSFLCPPVAIAVAATGAAGALGSFVGTIASMILEKKTRQEGDEPIIYPKNSTNLDSNTQADQFDQPRAKYTT